MAHGLHRLLILVLSSAVVDAYAASETQTEVRTQGSTLVEGTTRKFDDALGAMASGTYSLFNGVCEEGRVEDQIKDLERASKTLCPNLRPAGGSQDVEALAAASAAVETSAEDHFFSILASQHANELDCAADFALQTAGGKSDLLEATTVKLKALREVKQRLTRASVQLESDTRIMAKLCPNSVSELDSRNPNFSLCGEIIRSRAAVQTLQKSIYLSGTPSVADYIDRYTSTPADQISALDKRLDAELSQAYRTAERDLRNEAGKLRGEVRTSGGRGFSRGAKQDLLLSDPAVVDRVVQAGGDTLAMKGLACRTNARYGRGAQVLDTTLMVGSLGLSMGVGVALKAGAIGSRAVAATTAARAGGQISLNSTMMFQATVVGIDSVSAYSNLMNACATSARPNVVAHSAAGKGGTCVSAPSVQNVERDSCVLESSLSAIGFGAATLPSIAKLRNLRGSKSRAENAEQVIDGKAANTPHGEVIDNTRSQPFAADEAPIALDVGGEADQALGQGAVQRSQSRRGQVRRSGKVQSEKVDLPESDAQELAPAAQPVPSKVSAPPVRSPDIVTAEFEGLGLKERNQFRGVVGSIDDRKTEIAVIDRYLQVRKHTGTLVQYDLQDILLRGQQTDKQELRNILARAVERGEPLEVTRSKISQLVGEVKLRFLDEKIADAKRPADVYKLTQLAFENDIPASRRALRLLQTGGTELRENLYAALKGGKRDEVFTLMSEHNPKDPSAVTRSRFQAREMRREVTEASRRPRQSLSDDRRRSIDSNRQSELSKTPGFKTVRASSADVIEVRERFPAIHDKIDSEHDRLRSLKLLKQVESVDELPFEDALKQKLTNVDPQQQTSIVATWNRMNDPEAFANYTRVLAEDAAVEMMKRGTDRDLQALSRGELNRSAVMSVLVRRHRAQGRPEFSTLTSASGAKKPSSKTRKTDSNEDFRAAIAQGPFFDRPFNGARHGIDSHFVQMDYVAPVVWGTTKQKPAEFWNFLGSRKGINYWVPLFDGQENKSLTRPEELSHFLSPLLRITD